MDTDRYKFQKYSGKSSRFVCPQCERKETFVLYIDTETGEPVNSKVGKCNREDHCGYHYTPNQYFQDNNIKPDTTTQTHTKPIEIKPTSYIEPELFFASLKGYEDNKFIQYLSTLFDTEVVKQLIEKYYIGSSNLWPGSTIFYQIDTKGRIRTGKIMLYDALTGKRIKKPSDCINWVHKLIKQPEFNQKQCFFGEHLLKDEAKPVAIVESEKTALIASVYMPQFIWIAAGNLHGLTVEKCAVLMGRTVVLYPDLNKGFEVWSAKVKELSYITKFKVSNLLENIASEEERNSGLDLADYLPRFNYKDFIQSESVPTPELIEALELIPVAVHLIPKPPAQIPEHIPIQEYNPELLPQVEPIPGNWDNEIKELENYFNPKTLPTSPVQLNPFTLISNVAYFVESNLCIVRAQNGIRTFRPYLNRLQELRQCLN